METTDKLGKRQQETLPKLVAVMCEAIADLVRLVSPAVTQRDLDELPLSTLAAQLQGATNVAIGQEGTRAVFLSKRSIVEKQLESETDTELVVRNAAGRLIRIRLAADPDVRVGEEMGTDSSTSYKVAIDRNPQFHDMSGRLVVASVVVVILLLVGEMVGWALRDSLRANPNLSATWDGLLGILAGAFPVALGAVLGAAGALIVAIVNREEARRARF